MRVATDEEIEAFIHVKFGSKKPKELSGTDKELYAQAKIDREIPDEFDVAKALEELSKPVATKTIDALLDRLSVLRLKPYDEVRDEYLEINRELTNRKMIPPSFRPLRKHVFKPAKDYTPDETLLLVDHIVMDLHWLYVTARQRLQRSKIRDLFKAPEFNELEARELAEKNFRLSQKAGEWDISEADQILLIAIRTEDAKNKLERLHKRASDFLGAMDCLSESDRRVKRVVSGWGDMWLAREIAREKLRGKEPSLQAVSDVYTMITGCQLARPTIAAKLKRIDERLGKLGRAI